MRNDDPTINYHGGHPNSSTAFERTDTTRDLRVLLEVLKAHPAGITCDEAEIVTGMAHQTCSARFTDMKRFGWVEQIGRRPTRTGSPADIHRLIRNKKEDIRMRDKSELRDYQNRIAGELYENDTRIAVARPGGGKTAAGLTAFQELQRDGHVRHAIVIAPKRVARMVWPDEIALWSHTAGLRYQVLTGTPRQRAEQLSCAPDYDLTIIGIDNVKWLLDELVSYPDSHCLFDLLIIDEVSKLRDPTGVRAKHLLRYAKRWRMRWGLTGTLRPSGPEDLFMPAAVITNGKLWGRSFYSWRKQRFYPVDYQGYQWAPLPGAEEVINGEIAPLCSTLRDDELPQLPELSIIFDRVTLPSTARQQYNDMEERLIARAGDGAVLAASAAVATGKLAQLANGFVYDNDGVTHRVHDEKREWVQDLIDNSAGPMLLVYEYREDLEMLRGLLGEDLPYLGDGVTNAQSDHNITQWNAGALPFMALHPASGGHGLNLQHGGSDMAWISPTWSPELWEQTIARLHRSGQTKPVIVRVCLAHDTVDQMKVDRVHHKMTAQQAFEKYLRGAAGGAVIVEVEGKLAGTA